ncbi:inositol oxygenase [Chloropicon primus]|uniref:Inositol oxygenase n=1 Tax=Chloropicon primus TaxID=1764295 RepID=A0A5B8MGR3_9CHLO|nr:inositol oxygenase [Chloropicon primus]UPQ97749.1 inositol oxygenase [Chloropicon primus]|eukprot:QDZ18540.1 inositol oxygenase [Chloropicon primus]
MPGDITTTSNGCTTGVQSVFACHDAQPYALTTSRASLDELHIVSDGKKASGLRLRHCWSENNVREAALSDCTPSTPRGILDRNNDLLACCSSESGRSSQDELSLDELSLDSSSSFPAVALVEDEETLRVSRARQTVDFVEKQRRSLLAQQTSTRLRLSAWEAVGRLEGVTLPSGVNALDYSMAVAAVCREKFPDARWLHLVAAVHELGVLSVTKDFGSSQVWTVAGESFPVGCKFSESISFSQYFSSNPDRRKRVFNKPLGSYENNCGLGQLKMSWGSPEYLYVVLGALNGASLPFQAMFLIRYQKFFSLESSRHYHELLGEDDVECLEMLFDFQKIVEEVRSWSPAQTEENLKRVDHSEHVEYVKTVLYEHLPQELVW